MSSWVVSWRSLQQPVEVDGEELTAAVIVVPGIEAPLVREEHAVVDQQKQVTGESPVGVEIPLVSQVVLAGRVGTNITDVPAGGRSPVPVEER